MFLPNFCYIHPSVEYPTATLGVHMVRFRINPQFGIELRRLRKKRGISQQAFADRIGMVRPALSLVELGQRNVSVDLALKMFIELQPNDTEFQRLVGALLDWRNAVCVHESPSLHASTKELNLSESAEAWLRENGVTQIGAAIAYIAAFPSEHTAEITRAVERLGIKMK